VDLSFQPGSALAIDTDITLEPHFSHAKLIPEESCALLNLGGKQVREDCLDHLSNLRVFKPNKYTLFLNFGREA
jgi:hypothetical protein